VGPTDRPTEFSTTFSFGNEDHTLGNSLRHILTQRPEVEFCGYSVPHPYEPKMNIRIQTNSTTAIDSLELGLKDLECMCDIIENRFLNEVKNCTK